MQAPAGAVRTGVPASSWTLVAVLALAMSASSAASGKQAEADALPSAAAVDAPVDGYGWLDLSFNRESFRRLGLQLEGAGPQSLLLKLPASRSPLRLELADGAPTAWLSGELAVPGLHFLRADGARSPDLTLRGGDGLELQLTDAQGALWLHIGHAMRSPDPRRDGLRLYTADLRAGPALAAFSGRIEADDLLANASLQLPMRWPPGALPAAPKSCAVPVWPGVAGAVADVMLTNIDSIAVLPGRCRNLENPELPCDGPGGVEGELVITPSATLRNSSAGNAADVPWHEKFSGVFPPYGNDQHPFLIWNLYRLDADGGLLQIARSGLKHAFATANSGCVDATCPPNGQVLGRGCGDLYNAGSNDCASFLGPRSDVIAARGQWGRCGSIHDPDCDGVQSATSGGGFCAAPVSSPAGDGYSFRLRARESDVDSSLHPDAAFLLDAWYVVRDDVDIFNNMGHRSLQPRFSDGVWQPGNLGSYRSGAVIDHWLSLAPAGARSHRSLLESEEGRAVVAVRVVRLPQGSYRYDYAVMNFDFARAAIAADSAEPNLRVLRNHGFASLQLALLNGARVQSSEFRDGDGNLSNDWSATVGTSALSSAAAPSATLDWGSLLSLRVVSRAPPALGTMRLGVAESGEPADYALHTLVPDGAQVFADGFD